MHTINTEIPRNTLLIKPSHSNAILLPRTYRYKNAIQHSLLMFTLSVACGVTF